MEYPGFHNGRPCKACTSAEEMMRLGQKIIAQKEKNLEGNATILNEQQMSNNDTTFSPVQIDSSEKKTLVNRTDCPVDKDLLGNSTWNLLHTMSVYYPEKPKQSEQDDMKNLLENLSKVYYYKRNYIYIYVF